jgi:hypothetical protein
MAGDFLDVMIKIIIALAANVVSLAKTLSVLLRELLSSMGGIFVGRSLGPYMGAVIVFAVVILIIRFFISESKLILSLAAILLFVMFLAVLV